MSGAFTSRASHRGKAVPRVTMRGGCARAYTPAKTAMYENLVKAMYLEKHGGKPLLDGPVRMEIMAFCQMPKSSKVKARKMAAGDILPDKKSQTSTMS